LNLLYLATPQFHGSDCDQDGFRWLDLHNAEDSVWAFQRRSTGQDPGAPVTCIFNATPVPRDRYTLGVADGGEYRKIFDSDAASFGGSGYSRESTVASAAPGQHGNPFKLTLDLPPLGAIFFLGPA
jgi:1,4-alpha-glucan branching enzyme